VAFYPRARAPDTPTTHPPIVRTRVADHTRAIVQPVLIAATGAALMAQPGLMTRSRHQD
jgi:hypothetical protein